MESLITSFFSSEIELLFQVGIGYSDPNKYIIDGGSTSSQPSWLALIIIIGLGYAIFQIINEGLPNFFPIMVGLVLLYAASGAIAGVLHLIGFPVGDTGILVIFLISLAILHFKKPFD